MIQSFVELSTFNSTSHSLAIHYIKTHEEYQMEHVVVMVTTLSSLMLPPLIMTRMKRAVHLSKSQLVRVEDNHYY